MSAPAPATPTEIAKKTSRTEAHKAAQRLVEAREKSTKNAQERTDARVAELRKSDTSTTTSSANKPSATSPSATSPSATSPSATSPSATSPSATSPSATSPSATNAAAKAAANAPSAGSAILAASAAASAAVLPTGANGFTAFKILGIFILVILVIYFIIQSGFIARTYKRINSTPSDANNAQIAREQLAVIAPESDQLAGRRGGVFEAFRGWVNGAKEGFVSADGSATQSQMAAATAAAATKAGQPQAIRSVTPGSATQTRQQQQMPPEGERALLNFSVLGCRVAGYLGPKMNGVFKEEDAIKNALERGCRLFIFDIDYLERSPSKPVLVCRDENGNLLSNNVGSIAKAAASLAAFTRNQRMAATDPILIVLNVRRLPEKSPLARANINFMGEIASQLVPVQPYLLRSVPQGDAQQQRLEEVLFKLPIQTFESQMLLLTNLDTRGFRQVEDATISPARNLDILVHARIYTSENSALYYYQLPTANTAASALVQTYGYYDTIPENRAASEADKTRNTWSMAMSAELDTPPNAGQLEKLVNQLGVQGIVIDPFAEPAALADVLSNAWFGKKSYIAKPAEIRYKEPAVVAIAPADKRIDANGGMLVTPNVS